jgi:hypothetical protein
MQNGLWTEVLNVAWKVRTVDRVFAGLSPGTVNWTNPGDDVPACT